MTAPCVEFRLSNGPVQTRPLVDRLYIGRSCAGVAENQRIVIVDSEVSRDHAVIILHPSGVSIRDTSQNGTRVNGKRITPGTDYWLHGNDCITIGPCEMIVRCSPAVTHDLRPTSHDATHVLSVQQSITHLVADVRGFSSLTQKYASSDICSLISKLYDVLTNVVVRHQGVIKDYAGDAIFAFWEHGIEENAQAAVDACRAALDQQREVQQTLSEATLPESVQGQIKLGWGIATGKATVSHYGVRHDNLAVVGDSTNLAFRLAAMASKELPSIVTCQKTALCTGNEFLLQNLGNVATKGRVGLEPVYALYEHDRPK